MISVKLDENLGLSAIELLRHAGYAAERVYDEGLSGAKDPVVWQRVCQEHRFFITLDLDFADIRRFPQEAILECFCSGRGAAAEMPS
jgi:predicted nuclease of predicted toxin-antitoxin system